MQKMQAKAQTLGIAEKVRFLGIRSDVADMMQAMDVFVFPSLYEGLPVSLVEAQSAGLPCVISAAVSPESILTDLVQQLPLDSAGNWAEQVICAARRERKDTYDAICAAGFDIAKNAKWLEEFYLGAE